MSQVLTSPSDGYEGNRYIHTQGGRFYVERPVWRPYAIAHSLAQTSRFRGHADYFYSVAEHSVLVSLLMQYEVGGDPREGLWHEAAESVLPDVSSPLKGLFPDLRAWERKLESSAREALGLPPGKTSECKEADWLAVFIESYYMLPEGGADFEDPYGLRPKALALVNGPTSAYMPHSNDWQVALTEFTERSLQLGEAYFSYDTDEDGF